MHAGTWNARKPRFLTDGDQNGEMHLVAETRGRWFSAARSREFVTVRPRRCVTLVWNVPALGSDPELSRRRQADRASAYLPAHDRCPRTMELSQGYQHDDEVRPRIWLRLRSERGPDPGPRDLGTWVIPSVSGRTEMSQCGSPKSSKKKSGGGRGRSYRPGRHRGCPEYDAALSVRGGIALDIAIDARGAERASCALGTLILRVPNGIRNETGSYDPTSWILSACSF